MKATLREPPIVARKGDPVSVIIPIKDYEELLDVLEDTGDMAWLRRARRRPLHDRPVENRPAGHSLRPSGAGRAPCAST